MVGSLGQMISDSDEPVWGRSSVRVAMLICGKLSSEGWGSIAVGRRSAGADVRPSVDVEAVGILHPTGGSSCWLQVSKFFIGNKGGSCYHVQYIIF